MSRTQIAPINLTPGGPNWSTTGSLSANTVYAPTAYHTSVVNGSPLMYRNRLINGDMRIDQRAAGGIFSLSAASNNSAGSYGTADRWILGTTGSYLSGQRVSGSPFGTQYALALSGATGNTISQLTQHIEATNCYDLAGKTVTLSFQAYANQTINNVNTSYVVTSATDYWQPSNQNQFASYSIGNYTLTTTPTQYSFTFTFNPATSAINGMALYPFNAPLTNGQAVYFTNVQLEAGPVATPFEVRPIGSELVLCQRYLIAYTGQTNGNNSNICAGVDNGNFQMVGNVSFPVVMRASPTMTYSAAGDISWVKTNGNSTQNATSLTLYSSCPNAVVFLGGGSSVGTAPVTIYVSGAAGSANPHLWFSAEI